MHADPSLRARVRTRVEHACVCIYICTNGCGCHRRIYLGQYHRGINPGNRSLSDKIIPRIQWGEGEVLINRRLILAWKGEREGEVPSWSANNFTEAWGFLPPEARNARVLSVGAF